MNTMKMLGWRYPSSKGMCEVASYIAKHARGSILDTSCGAVKHQTTVRFGNYRLLQIGGYNY